MHPDKDIFAGPFRVQNFEIVKDLQAYQKHIKENTWDAPAAKVIW